MALWHRKLFPSVHGGGLSRIPNGIAPMRVYSELSGWRSRWDNNGQSQSRHFEKNAIADSSPRRATPHRRQGGRTDGAVRPVGGGENGAGAESRPAGGDQ